MPSYSVRARMGGSALFALTTSGTLAASPLAEPQPAMAAPPTGAPVNQTEATENATPIVGGGLRKDAPRTASTTAAFHGEVGLDFHGYGLSGRPFVGYTVPDHPYHSAFASYGVQIGFLF
jgi:hypothetical protein